MVKKTNFSDGKISVYFATGDASPYLVSVCDTIDIALGVALNLHQLSNSPHVISVEDDHYVEVATLRRLDFVPLKLQTNGR